MFTLDSTRIYSLLDVLILKPKSLRIYIPPMQICREWIQLSSEIGCVLCVNDGLITTAARTRNQHISTTHTRTRTHISEPIRRSQMRHIFAAIVQFCIDSLKSSLRLSFGLEIKKKTRFLIDWLTCSVLEWREHNHLQNVPMRMTLNQPEILVNAVCAWNNLFVDSVHVIALISAIEVCARIWRDRQSVRVCVRVEKFRVFSFRT